MPWPLRASSGLRRARTWDETAPMNPIYLSPLSSHSHPEASSLDAVRSQPASFAQGQSCRLEHFGWPTEPPFGELPSGLAVERRCVRRRADFRQRHYRVDRWVCCQHSKLMRVPQRRWCRHRSSTHQTDCVSSDTAKLLFSATVDAVQS